MSNLNFNTMEKFHGFNPNKLQEILNEQKVLLSGLNGNEFMTEYFKRFPSRGEHFENLERQAKEERRKFNALTKEQQKEVVEILKGGGPRHMLV